MRYRLLILAAAVLFSTGGAAIKSASLTSWQVACFRSGVAAVALLLLVPASRRLRNYRVWVAAAAYAATMILFVAANKLTTAANAIFIQSTAPLYLLLLGPWLLKEPIRRRDSGLHGRGGGRALAVLLRHGTHRRRPRRTRRAATCWR